jgi:hypothetical protein
VERIIINHLATESESLSVAIMQPYFFAYIGYFQLMACASCFVILDDVHYIKQGWINRNRLLFQGISKFFTLPLIGSSSNRLISELKIHRPEASKRHILDQVENYYRRAPNFHTVYPLLEKWIMNPEERLVPYLCHTIRETSHHIGLRAPTLISSEMPKDPELKGQDRIIQMCKILGARHYINVIAGKELYDPAVFEQNSISLSFLKGVSRPYPQFGEPFVPGLSIIDMLMFNSVEMIRGELDKGEITKAN